MRILFPPIESATGVLLLSLAVSCCQPTTRESSWNQTWEPRFNEYIHQGGPITSPSEAREVLRLALMARGITYRPRAFANVPRWRESVYGAFLIFSYRLRSLQEPLETYMTSLGYIDRGSNSRSEISAEDQIKILEEFDRLIDGKEKR